MTRARILVSLLSGLPLVLLAFTNTPFVRRAGVPTDDNGATCTACHQPGNGTGRVTLDIATYIPGETQTIHVAIADPNASRWGFQLTARPLNDTTQEAGTFTPVDPTLVRVRCDDGTSTGSAAPCNGLREFAEHVNAPNMSGGGYTFVVNWTPPIQEVGKIAFYVAALAANGDNTTAGDNTYTAVQMVPLSPNAACGNTQTPNLERVVDAASFSSNLASGGLWTIFGFDFETSNLQRSAGPGDFVNGAFPGVLACIAVEINGTAVPIAYVQTGQINLQGPSLSGPASVVVVSNAGKPNELRSIMANITVLPLAPVFFTFNGTSIAAQFANTSNVVADPSVVPSGLPAKPGDIVTLYGTGFGTTGQPVAPGSLATGISTVTAPVTVTIGGVTLAPQDVLYVGLSPGSIGGLYQLNVRIPASTLDGDIPVVASAGGVQTQSGATIPVKSSQ
jgi:uncharacterized protein (TIGR03437 family)